MQWDLQFPRGGGFVTLGPNKRKFGITMFHQLRCLGYIRQSIAAESADDMQYADHCLNYLRQMTLCHSDITLEPAMDENLALDTSRTHTCKDWTALWLDVERNHDMNS